MNNYLAATQALLFVAGDDGLTLEEISYVVGIDKTAVRQLLEELMEQLKDETSGLELILTAQRYKFVTKASLKPYLEKYAVSPFSSQLSSAALETLAIIAYKQPITRLEVESIRGVQCSGAIQKLLLRDLIEEAGRMDSPGRPKLYRTTTYFMDYFGLETLDQLPDVESLLELNQEESKQLFKNNEDLFAELEQMHQEEDDIS